MGATMALAAENIEEADLAYRVAKPFCHSAWYAAYTWANHEKKVDAELRRRSVESFLPLYTALRQWKDRRVRIDLPLFPGYIFVHVALRDRLQVLQVRGVARLVGFGGLPVALPDEQVNTLRAGLRGPVRAEPYPYVDFVAGRRVQVKTGPFAGMTGILMTRKNRTRLVVSVDMIQRAVAVEVDAAEVGPVAGESDRSCLRP